MVSAKSEGGPELGVFDVRIAGAPNHPVVTVIGELDLGTAPRLRDALRSIPDDVQAVDVDLSQVTFIDSTALGVLLAAYKRFQVLGTELGVSASSRVVSKVLEISGLSSLLGTGSVSTG